MTTQTADTRSQTEPRFHLGSVFATARDLTITTLCLVLTVVLVAQILSGVTTAERGLQTGPVQGAAQTIVT